MTKTVLNLLWNKISKNFSTKKLVIDALANKQDLIIDIATIRSNSLSAYLKPSTGIPAGDLASGVVPTNVSSFTNDSKYVTEDDMQVDVIDANGHEYVDLDLPSGTLWATMNIGASSETDYGNYYQYGKGADQYAATSGQSAYSGKEDPLDSSVDTAVQVWGGDWHMPTKDQFEELTANTTYEWTTINGVNGGKFTAQNGNYVFFAAAGYWYDGSQDEVDTLGMYWSSSPSSEGRVYRLRVNADYGDVPYNGTRLAGHPVRPVLNASKSPKYATKAELAGVATSGSYNDLSDKPTIPTVPTNVSTFTNDANYVTQDTLDDILGVDVNGLTQIKEVLSDDDTTTGLINLIGLKVNVEDVLSITDTEINRLFNPALFLRVSSELQGTSIVVNEIGKIVKFNEGVNQWILTYTMDGFRPDTVSLYSSSSSNFGQVTTPIEVTTSNEGAIWLFQYNNVNYTLNRNNLSVSPSITLF